MIEPLLLCHGGAVLLVLLLFWGTQLRHDRRRGTRR